MSWEDRQRDASFGGLDLLVRTIEEVVGRRTTSIEYPDRDRPSSQDHGRSARRWSVAVVVVGENFDLDLAALRNLAETEGPHRWVHPFTGEIEVTLSGGLTTAIDTGQRRKAEITFQIVEAGESAGQLLATKQTGPELAAAADAMGIALGLNLEGALQVSNGGTAWARANAMVIGASVSASLIAGKVSAAVNKPNQVGQLVRAFADEADTLTSSPAALVSSLRGLAAAGFGTVADAEGDEVDELGAVDTVAAGARARALVESMRAASDWTPPEQGDPPDEEQAQNDGALEQAVELANVAEAVTVLSGLTLDAADTALEVLAAVAETIDAQLEAEWTGDDLYTAAVDLKAATAAHFRDLANRLPSVTEHTPTDTVPAFLLAFRLYGDVEREPEIVGRNAIPDPARVQAGRALEVLGA